jgi:hypothetical protein
LKVVRSSDEVPSEKSIVRATRTDAKVQAVLEEALMSGLRPGALVRKLEILRTEKKLPLTTAVPERADAPAPALVLLADVGRGL